MFKVQVCLKPSILQAKRKRAKKRASEIEDSDNDDSQEDQLAAKDLSKGKKQLCSLQVSATSNILYYRTCDLPNLRNYSIISMDADDLLIGTDDDDDFEPAARRQPRWREDTADAGNDVRKLNVKQVLYPILYLKEYEEILLFFRGSQKLGTQIAACPVCPFVEISDSCEKVAILDSLHARSHLFAADM